MRYFLFSPLLVFALNFHLSFGNTITSSPVSPVAGCRDTLTTTIISDSMFYWYFSPNALIAEDSGRNLQVVTNYFLRPGNDTVRLLVKMPGGIFQSDSIIVDVLPGNVDVSLAADTPDLCPGTPVVFTASPSTYLFYTFLINDIPVQSLEPADTFVTTSLHAGDSVWALGYNGTCYTNPSPALYPTVYPLPAATTLTSSYPSDTICSGDTVTFTALPDGQGQYWFYVGGSLQQNDTSNVWTTDQIYNGNVFYVRVIANGCPGIPSNGDTFTVCPTPFVVISEQDSTLFGSSSVSGSQFQWYDTGTIIPGADSSTYISNQPGIYSARAMGPCGCWSRMSDTINTFPYAQPAFTGTPTFGCDSFTTTFTDQSTNNPTRWLWRFPGGSPAQSIVQNPIVYYDTTGTFNVTLIVGNPYGSDSLTMSDYISVGVAPAQPLCMVTADSTNTREIVVWEKANKYATDSFFIYRTITPDTFYQLIASIPRDSLSEYVDTAAQPSQMSYRYKINLLDTCGHYSSLSPYHQTVYLQSPNGTLFQWTPYAIENDSIPDVLAYNLLRDTTGQGNWQVISTVPYSQTYTTISDFYSYPNASYKVEAQLIISCLPTRGIDVISSNIISYAQILGINNVPATDISLWPNPAHDKIELSFTNTSGSFSKLTVFDQLGNILPFAYIAAATGKIDVDISHLSNGIYYIHATCENNSAVFKLIKE